MQISEDLDGEMLGESSGWSVSMNQDGTRLVVGSPKYGASAFSDAEGLVTVYLLHECPPTPNPSTVPSLSSIPSLMPSKSLSPSSSPSFAPTLNCNNSVLSQIGTEIEGDEDSILGKKVSMSNDGSIFAVSSIHAIDDGVSEITYVYRVKIYKEDNTTAVGWTQLGSSIDGVDPSTFITDAKSDVSVSGDGKKVAISTVYASQRPGSTTGSTGGKVDIYEYSLSANSSSAMDWIKIANVYDDDAGKGGEDLGLRVSLDDSGTRVAIGERYFDSDGLENRGRVIVCDAEGGSTPSYSCTNVTVSGDAWEQVGSSVMISGDGSCVVYGAVGSDVNGVDSGSGSVYCFDGSEWSRRGIQLKGEAAGDEFGFSVAISSDSEYIAIGAWRNDAENQINAGHVRVFRFDSISETYEQVGEDIDGERGMSNVGAYYEGDFSGFSVAIGDENDGFVTVAIGAPNNAGDGGYYNGHVRVYLVDILSPSPVWMQISEDLDGEMLGESSGWSVSMNQDGTKLVVGSPQYQSTDAYTRGAMRVFDVIHCFSRTSQPSTRPSLSPSLTPSSAPSSVPSSNPSNSPSAEYERTFRIRAISDRFSEDYDWCLTAANLAIGYSGPSKLYVRPCSSTPEFQKYQYWVSDQYGQFQLAKIKGDKICMVSTSRAIHLDTCSFMEGQPPDRLLFGIEEVGNTANNSMISQEKYGKKYYLGFDPNRKFSRVKLYMDGALNPTLAEWFIEYGDL
jgi:hypothetical protein